MNRQIYLDNAATTKIADEVLDVMLPWMKEGYGNASSIYSFGNKSKVAIEEARDQIASYFGCKAKELFFTSGGSEADNWAIKGVAHKYKSKGNHLITTKIEHHAVLHTMAALEKEGYEVTYLDVDEEGFVDPKDVEAAITDKTILVSVMFANNEIGTIEPIKEIGKICRDKGVLFHTDAVQAVGSVRINVEEYNIDLMSMSGHKIHAPKGIGALYVRTGVKLDNLIDGGAQERGKRAGTENVAAIVGYAKAFELAYTGLEERNKKIMTLRNKLRDRILNEIEYVRLNGAKDDDKRLVNNLNVCFKFIEGESLLLLLDDKGIMASSGSACTSGSLDPSHVLLSIGLPHEIAHGSLRFTLSEETTEEDVDYVVDSLKEIVQRLRDMSPLYKNFVEGEK